ncbi:MAG: Rrf2 family transcriptional regulator [Myxococcales bacterium]|nr:Rrf2 family transcriptional regulator [Polyangiaceae bacterium]MDW8251704.1 Rrf2 family transcriptional regulator [Myxococcales bacterium]
MHLTQQTDVALRILLHLAMHPGQVVPASEISRSFQLRQEHTAKVAKRLVREGLVESRRGRFGGLVLTKAPEELRLGQLVQRLEPLTLLGCLQGESDCPIHSSCVLKGALRSATQAFVQALDSFTLADLIRNRPQLLRLLGPRPERGTAGA